jgi:hypothetical protein
MAEKSCKTCYYMQDYFDQVHHGWVLGSRCHDCSGGGHNIKVKYKYWKADLEKQILRLEVLNGLEAPPKKWDITPKRIVALSQKIKCSLSMARTMLIKAFGEKLPEEK